MEDLVTANVKIHGSSHQVLKGAFCSSTLKMLFQSSLASTSVSVYQQREFSNHILHLKAVRLSPKVPIETCVCMENAFAVEKD